MLKLNSEIAELIGMHVGDGTLYCTSRGLVWELRGALNEKDYYNDHVVPLLLSIFRRTYVAKLRSGGKNDVMVYKFLKKKSHPSFSIMVLNLEAKHILYGFQNILCNLLGVYN